MVPMGMAGERLTITRTMRRESTLSRGMAMVVLHHAANLRMEALFLDSTRRVDTYDPAGGGGGSERW